MEIEQASVRQNVLVTYGSAIYAAVNVPVAAFVISRIGLLLLVYFAIVFLPVRTDEGRFRLFPDNLFLDGWIRWDSHYYKDIAEFGYTDDPTFQGFRRTSFWPLYSVITRGVMLVVPNTEISALIVSNTAFLIALILFHRLVIRRHNIQVANRAIVLICVFPFSFFFSAMYTESTFLLTAVAAFYFAEKRWWLAAAVCAALAGTARIVGVLTVFGILLIYLEQIGYQWRRIKRDILWLLLGFLGPLIIMGYMAVNFGDAFLFLRNFENQAENYVVSKIVATFTQLTPDVLATGNYFAMDVIHLVTAILSFGVIFAGWKRVNKPYLLWALVTMAASLTVWGSFGRYVSPVFPLFIVLAIYSSRPSVFLTVTYIFTLFLSLLAILFATWNWVA